VNKFYLQAFENSALKTYIKEYDRPLLEKLKFVALDKSFPADIDREEFELSF